MSVVLQVCIGLQRFKLTESTSSTNYEVLNTVSSYHVGNHEAGSNEKECIMKNKQDYLSMVSVVGLNLPCT